MPKRKKPQQANSLASWAGAAKDPSAVASATEGSPDQAKTGATDVLRQPTRAGVLVFKLNSAKLSEYQAKVLQELTGGRDSDDETVSDHTGVAKHDARLFNQYCDVNIVPDSDPADPADELVHKAKDQPTKPVHPFFLGKKVSSGASAESRAEAKPFKLKGTGEGEVHGFFKPKPKSARPAQADGNAPVRVLKGSDTPTPTRAEMHIVPPTSPDVTLGPGDSRPAKRRRIAMTCDDDEAPVPFALTAISRTIKLAPLSSSTPAKAGRTSKGVTVCDPATATNLNNAPQSDLWQDRCAPIEAAQIGDQSRGRIFRDWLQSRRLRKDAARFDAALLKSLSQSKFADELDDFIVDDDDPVSAAPPTSDLGYDFEDHTQTPGPAGYEKLWSSNLAVLDGPHGCGKSALVQATARELEFEIFEVNSSSRRSGRDIVERVGEAAQSRMVNKHGVARKSLILFEECDVLFRDDKDFWPAVLALAARSRRPVVLTVTDISILPEIVQSGGVLLELRPMPDAAAADCLHRMVAQEGRTSSVERIADLYAEREHDLRGTLCQLQFDTLSSTYHQPPRLPEHASAPRTLKAHAHKAELQSMLDLASTHARSSYLEEHEVYESEGLEETARVPHKDDLVGNVLISEPYGRFTELQAGDFDLAAELYSFWSRHIAMESPMDLQTDWSLTAEPWETIHAACEPLSLPADWMLDTLPRSLLHASRSAHILTGELAPRLRSMCRLDDIYLAWEASVLSQYKGRLTRNTMQSEYGFHRRDLKIDRRLHKQLLDTSPEIWSAYDLMAQPVQVDAPWPDDELVGELSSTQSDAEQVGARPVPAATLPEPQPI